MSETPLGFVLFEVARLYRARTERAFEQAGLGITSGEARTLVYVNQHPGLRQTALAEKMNVEPMTLVASLDRLEAHDLVRREPDPSDRRAKLVNLTPSAAPLMARITAVAAEARAETLQGLSDDQVAAFRATLEHLRANLVRCARAPEDA
ncbi:MarR family winged helix-turn-helix transcriptional regulator [Azorhizobium doebereinerae]|uniref:MarR family winged helix-turn-helix transcriptional regulator n=1 Tax=Azorhizobium doebereinerae TaxID=281091 RepID=UPI00041B6AC2|nr:MarR family transcriptional regulator [Azorhizobium doebereinerae]